MKCVVLEQFVNELLGCHRKDEPNQKIWNRMLIDFFIFSGQI